MVMAGLGEVTIVGVVLGCLGIEMVVLRSRVGVTYLLTGEEAGLFLKGRTILREVRVCGRSS
jgi:hypothetical protein